jgi:hypothetical protein
MIPKGEPGQWGRHRLFRSSCLELDMICFKAWADDEQAILGVSTHKGSRLR